jgi:hypothetical protein
MQVAEQKAIQRLCDCPDQGFLGHDGPCKLPLQRVAQRIPSSPKESAEFAVPIRSDSRYAQAESPHGRKQMLQAFQYIIVGSAAWPPQDAHRDRRTANHVWCHYENEQPTRYITSQHALPNETLQLSRVRAHGLRSVEIHNVVPNQSGHVPVTANPHVLHRRHRIQGQSQCDVTLMLQPGLGRLQWCAKRGNHVIGSAKILKGIFQSRLRNLAPMRSHPPELDESGQDAAVDLVIRSIFPSALNANSARHLTLELRLPACPCGPLTHPAGSTICDLRLPFRIVA